MTLPLVSPLPDDSDKLPEAPVDATPVATIIVPVSGLSCVVNLKLPLDEPPEPVSTKIDPPAALPVVEPDIIVMLPPFEVAPDVSPTLTTKLPGLADAAPVVIIT
jgi:hypothetical protein